MILFDFAEPLCNLRLALRCSLRVTFVTAFSFLGAACFLSGRGLWVVRVLLTVYFPCSFVFLRAPSRAGLQRVRSRGVRTEHGRSDDDVHET